MSFKMTSAQFSEEHFMACAYWEGATNQCTYPKPQGQAKAYM